MYARENVSIRKIVSKRNGIHYILLKSILNNGNEVYVRTPVTPIQDSVALSNNFIYVLGFAQLF